MGGYLPDLVPDPGAIVVTVFVLAVVAFVYCLCTDRRTISADVDDQFDPRPPVDPEAEARRRSF